MMNALRLNKGVPWVLFTERTGLSREDMSDKLNILITKKLMLDNYQRIQLTSLGQKFLNDVLEIMMD